MRVTNNYMMDNVLRNLQKNLERVDRYNKQLSTGKKFTLPSENPVGTMRSMQMTKILAENDQYISNIDQAKAWLEMTDSSLTEANKVLERARELTVYGSSGSLSADERTTIAKEIDQLVEHLVQIGNTTIGGRYVFAGSKTTTVPYTDADTPYQGDYQDLNVQIGENIKLPYNIPGGAVFDNSIQTLKDLSLNLKNDDVEAIQNNVAQMDLCTTDILDHQAEVGSRVKRVEMVASRFEKMGLHYTELLSTIEDVDIAETIMNLKMQESVYNASLSSNARIIQPSLLDYLR